jgi:5-enolpyruvylshikimate-3-phosphate synthase
MYERTHRRYRLIQAVADSGNAIEISRNLLAEGNKALRGVEQQKGEECDRVAPYATSQGK